MFVFPAPYVSTAGPFAAGNQSAADIYTLLQTMSAGNDDMSSPSAGGTLTINSESLGSYDYVIKDGNQSVSTFTAADWFTATEDSRSAFAVVKGDLTIGSAQTFIPGVRKLFTAIYVTGDLTVTGNISMSARGANHSATGSSISAAAIRIATGTFSSVTNPQVPASGAAAGAAVTATNPGNPGSTGTAGQTGGGASGGASSSGTSGAGAAGTSFSGGPGGGAVRTGGPGESGAANGGKGGDASADGVADKGGGAGNPGGTGFDGGDNGDDGTGGVLIIIVAGTLSGAGNITAAGADGGDTANGANDTGGGASGGGSITILYGTDSGPTPTALGGTGGIGGAAAGGDGGDGTARKLAL